MNKDYFYYYTGKYQVITSTGKWAQVSIGTSLTRHSYVYRLLFIDLFSRFSYNLDGNGIP